jgi:Leucine-rich repeat (LRR) protein
MKRSLLTIILSAIVALVTKAQIVNIPDPVFKNYLLNHYYHSNPGGSGIQINLDANNDGEIQVSEATNYPGNLVSYAFFMNGLGITDLTGIEAFTSVRGIYVANNQLTSLNVNGCSSLKILDCSNNPMTSFTVVNLSLEELSVNNCSQLTAIDIHSSQNLKKFTCQSNANLTSLNLAGCWWLQELRVNFNPLLTAIEFGIFSYMYLTLFQCGSNALTSLDVSGLGALQILVCTGNQLTALNLANGHPQSFQIISANGHPDLFCIQVDNVTVAEVLWAPGGYYGFDSWAVFQTDCSNYNPNPTCTITIPDVNFKNALLSNPLINPNDNEEIECTEAVAYTGSIDVNNLGITDMTGIEAFVNITSLSCNDQQPFFGSQDYLTTLNISGLTALTTVSCTGNVELSAITAIGCTSLVSVGLGGSYAQSGITANLSNCSAMTTLNLSDKNLSSLNISGCVSLTTLNCGNNHLTSLNTSDSPALTSLLCNNNQLSALNTFDNPALNTLDCSNNQLPYLIVSLNPALTTLNCSYNNLTYMDLFNNTALVTLNCSHNNLNSISVNNNPVLYTVDCSYNELPTLNVSADAALNMLNCNYNQLTSLDVSSNATLVHLFCNYNNLPSIDVSNNHILETLSCAGNSIPAIDLSENVTLKNLDCSYNQLTSLDLIANTGLFVLNCANNQISTLDLNPTEVLFLIQFTCTENQLTELDLSNCSTVILFCENNDLEVLNIANGMNSMQSFMVWATDNPNLTCVQVDDAEYSEDNWTDNAFIQFDEGVSFSENCATPSYIDDVLDNPFAVYPNPTSGNVYFSQVAHVRIANALGQEVMNSKGTHMLDISNYPTGIYVITFLDDNGCVLQLSKVIKE